MFPLVDTIRNYDRSWLSADLAAAVTVWAIVVPESIAYASIAGMPPETGLYAASIPLLVYALLAGSRRVSFGPSAAIAAISAATVVPLAGGDPARVFTLTLGLAILTGVLLILAGIAKLGAIADFLSRPVLLGFLTGVGLTVAIGQMPKLLGVELEQHGFFAKVFELIRAIPEADIPTLIMGLAALALLFGLHRWIPRTPSALVVVVLSILVVGAFDLESRGIAVVGEIASGFPRLVMPDVGFTDLTILFGGALGLAIVVFGQSAALAKAFAATHRETVDANQEMRAIGVANVAGGFFGAFTTTGSESRTAAANAAGQKSQVATLLVGVMVLLTAAFLTGFFHNLPEAVLGAIVIHAVFGLIEFQPFTKLYRQNRGDFWAATATLLGVLVFEVLAGLLIGVFVSLGLLMAQVVRPRVVELGLDRSSGAFRGITEGDHLETVPGLRVIRFDAPIFFANIGVLQSTLSDLLADEATEAVVVDVSAGDSVDTTTTQALAVMMERFNEEGVGLVFARMHETVKNDLERGGVDLTDHLYPRVRDAVEAFRRGDLAVGRADPTPPPENPNQ